MHRLEWLFAWYGITIAALLLLYGAEVEGRYLWAAAHLGVLIPSWLVSRLRSRLARAVYAALLTLGLFTALGHFIQDLVPVPFEYVVRTWDQAIGGAFVREALFDPPTLLIECCQICYASFYFLPMSLAVTLAVQKRYEAAVDVMVVIVGGFLLSYLGYVLMPTLPPYRFIAYPNELDGGPLFRFFWPLLHGLEGLRQDCMPSGHTMMTLLTLALAWRHARKQLLWLLPIGCFLILATVLLRLHWFVDLLVAVPFTALALWLFTWRAARPLPQSTPPVDSRHRGEA